MTGDVGPGAMSTLTYDARASASATEKTVMTRTRTFRSTRRLLAVLALVGSMAMPARSALADGVQSVDEPLTRFEKFLLEVCSPCVRESSALATLPVAPIKTSVWARSAAGRTARAGEVGVEALRSHLLGRPSRQMFAVRLNLSVATGNPGEVYRIASGVVDEEELAAFVSGLGDLVQAATAVAPTDAVVDTVEIDVRGGSIRVGVIRLKGESLAFVQAGDMRILTRRPIWEAPATLYLAVSDLATLRSAIAQAATRLQRMRGGQ